MNKYIRTYPNSGYPHGLQNYTKYSYNIKIDWKAVLALGLVLVGLVVTWKLMERDYCDNMYGYSCGYGLLK